MKLFLTIFIAFCLLFGFQQVNAMTIKCALPINGAYQYKGATSVFFVTKNCTKQIFSGPTAYLQRFASWKKIKMVSKTAINKIFKDRNYIIYPLSKNSSLDTTPTQTPQNPISIVPCNNNSKTGGGDGDYSVCVGNTIFHQPSGVLATIVSVDNSKAILSLSGLPGSYALTLTVYNNSTGQVGGNNGYSVIYKYGGISSLTGATLITISSSINAINQIQNPVTVVTSTVPKKFLTMVIVRDAPSEQYQDNGWGREINFTENDNLQVFNVVIWGGGQAAGSKKISVYKFNRTFDPRKDEYANGGSAWVNYRESFNILNVDIPAPSSEKIGTGALSSGEYLTAFKRIMDTVVRNQPAEHYGIKYLGHGTGDVALFAWKINPSDSESLLSYINAIIGKKIDFLDWNTNCGNGTYKLVQGEYRYADFILASDLLRGGYTFGQPDPGITYDTFTNALKFEEPTQMLDTFFYPGKTIRQSLIDMVNSQRTLWELALKNNMITNKIEQSISIYDSNNFESMATSANLNQNTQSGDILSYIKNNYPTQEQKFYDFRFHYVSNKDFFPWDTDSNGFKRN